MDLDEIRRYLVDSICHALWDVNTEYRLLTAPIMPTLAPQAHGTPASEPTTPKKGELSAVSSFLFYGSCRLGNRYMMSDIHLTSLFIFLDFLSFPDQVLW